MSSMVTNPMKINCTQDRAQVLDSYVKELSGEAIHSADRWKTMYKSSYNKLRSQDYENNIASPETISHREMKGPVDSHRFLVGDTCPSRSEGIPIQLIANSSPNLTGYRLVDSARCEWFVASGTESPWQTTYDSQFPNPKSRFAGIRNVTESPAKYRLEQVLRHMGNRVPN